MSENNYLLQEAGNYKFVLEDSSGFVLLESTAFPKIIRGAVEGRGPGSNVTARGGGAAVTSRGSGAIVTEI